MARFNELAGFTDAGAAGCVELVEFAGAGAAKLVDLAEFIYSKIC